MSLYTSYNHVLRLYVPLYRVRWQAYEHNCGYDKNVGGCTVGPAMCRAAQVGIMGTILTTNCTCVNMNSASHKRCEDDQRRIQHNTVCKGQLSYP